MREIKFRAWIGSHNRFADTVAVYNDGGWLAKIGEIGGYDENDGGILEQFTGLKDKNGKDIYEGDILKCEYGFMWRVEFSNGAFQLDDGFGGSYVICGHDEKVVGNIHENPELLDNAK